MKSSLLLMLAVTSTCFSTPTPGPLQDAKSPVLESFNIYDIPSLRKLGTLEFSGQSIEDIKRMMHQEAPNLRTAVINKVIKTLKCSRGYETENNNILTVIDYSLPSSEKRLWVFDLHNNRLLFNTYVSHGIKSGTRLSTFFSNKYNSKTSSIGAYTTEQSYYGRDGISLRLDGLDRGFNDNAANRAVVIHGGWYVNESFIKKYGRAGRSWGCPALPLDVAGPIINTIKNKSLLVIYYPSDDWFAKSKFLNCGIFSQKMIKHIPTYGYKLPIQENEVREDVLFVDLNKNNKHEENEPVIVVEAEQYKAIFNQSPPLGRMLRRQINEHEYIALTNQELETFVAKEKTLTNSSENTLQSLYFVIPVLKMQRGYYITQMTVITLGKIRDISKSDSIYFDDRASVSLKTTNQFIRWLGL